MATEPTVQMCPHCGGMIGLFGGLTSRHLFDGSWCPGSQQIPRCPESDGRRLWNGQPNRRYYRNQEA